MKYDKSTNESKNLKRGRKIRGKRSAWNFYCVDKVHASLGIESMAQKYKALSPKWKALEKAQKDTYYKLHKKDCERYDFEYSNLSPDEKLLMHKKKNTKKSTDKPKKGLSAYMFFMKDNRQRVKEQFNLSSFGEISRQMGLVWKSLTPDEKSVYCQKQTDDKERYRLEVEAVQLNTTTSKLTTTV